MAAKKIEAETAQDRLQPTNLAHLFSNKPAFMSPSRMLGKRKAGHECPALIAIDFYEPTTCQMQRAS